MAVSSRILYRAHRFSSISNHFISYSYTDLTDLEDALGKEVSKSKLLVCCVAQLVERLRRNPLGSGSNP